LKVQAADSNTQTMTNETSFPYSLIAIDLDGTLLNSSKEITENTVKTLRKLHHERAVKVVLASGRMTEKIVPFYTDVLGLNENVYMVGYNGAKCFHMASLGVINQLFHRPLAPSLYSQLFDYCMERELLLTLYLDGRCLTVANEKHSLSHSIFSNITNNHSWEYLESYYQLLENKTEITNGLIITDSEEIADQILDDLRSIFPKDMVHLVKTECATREYHQFYVEILHPLANKGKALESLSNHLGIAPDRILVFGDGENDIEMFKFAGYGICMSNACLNLKAIAHKVSPFSNNEEGVHKEIEKLLQLENSLK
jgi:Cof subfamily protein (haloacid dehalogenase superfamily)